MSDKPVYYLKLGNKYLDNSDQFRRASLRSSGNAEFPDKEAALVKASSLGLDLDEIRLIMATPTDELRQWFSSNYK